MRRREFISGLGGAAAAWPLAARAQQRAVPVIGYLVGGEQGIARVSPDLRKGLSEMGYVDGRNVVIELRSTDQSDRFSALATELVRRQVAVIYAGPPANGGSYFLPSFEAAARSLNVAPIAVPVRTDAEIEMAMISLGRELGAGVVVMPESFTNAHRAQIISQAAKNKVPSVYAISFIAREGGLLSYGPNYRDIFRRAALYVDRILRGAKPADLPVQLPVKFEMAVNAKTAKALDLTIPPSILVRADEVIE
jgi:putative tryptophan/tyrosine transport system substrate-binding protein